MHGIPSALFAVALLLLSNAALFVATRRLFVRFS
jgi:hypothetical protein